MNRRSGNRQRGLAPEELLFGLVDDMPDAEIERLYAGIAHGESARAAVYRNAERTARQLRKKWL